ncbi:hypothetical protein PLESTB_001720900 [Pleodorina starrii]|uniref:HTH CENPB-type domain-containing protein n=1 Tax=Pleodorina starrii TaxID=330485 RepID=A0A9W6F9Z1_9CHLO|nr:hypothetical protein PLESTM_001873000 [Pleodorina starrii]GLC61126.1 hypothetical protein PLESTB_001720900 [Pleodorina starrii]GLC69546.1 hypothetical protein PLESTF_000845700 [Pleodorina starrii]
MRRHGRTLTKIEVRCLAAEMEAIEAKAAGHKPRWAEGAAASEKWWRGYKQRHGVVLRSTQHAEAERQAAATSDVVYGFFETFEKVPLRYRQSADLGRDDCDSESSEQDGTVSETSSDTTSRVSED